MSSHVTKLGVVTAALLICAVAGAQVPETKWVFGAKSNLYAPPLTAELCPNPGLETILSDSEARRLRCIGADGKQLWEFDGGWKKRLISAAALSDADASGARLLAVGNADGSLVCVDAATGAERWRAQAGPVEWGGGVWADVDGGGAQALVVATLAQGIAAYSRAGAELWRWRGPEEGPPVEVACVPAAADADGDGKCEIYAGTRWGVVCLNGDGTPRWRQDTGDDFTASVVVADAENDGAAECYTMSRDDDFLWRLDARDGAVAWKLPLASGADVYNGSSIAVGDLDRDGLREVVAADRLGAVHAVRPSGVLMWMFRTGREVHAAVSLGDVDGNGAVDVLAASGDHNLYCLDGTGREQWRFTAGLRLVHPATITDVEGDGKTDMLVCGSDRNLYCLTLGGRYDAALVPWPSRRHDPAQTGSALGVPRRPVVETTRELFAYGAFEQGKVRDGLEQTPKDNPLRAEVLNRPRGWKCATPGADMALTAEIRHGGEKCVALDVPGEIVSDSIALEPGLRRVGAEIYGRGEGLSASLRWTGAAGLLREDALTAGVDADGWRPFSAEGIIPPPTAVFLSLALRSETPGACWDDAKITGVSSEAPTVAVLVNQAGYDTGAPKRFVVQANIKTGDARYEVLRGDGSTAHEGVLTPAGRITGAYGQDWGHEYYTGDLAAFDTPGKYRIRAVLDGAEGLSWPFEVGPDQLWKATARAAYRFFYYQRCGCEVPGFHGPCHLDDATGPDGKKQFDVAGGWHDAGDYNKYHNAPYVHGLARAYGWNPSDFDATATEAGGGFLDEILWGGAHARRMVTADGSSFGSITSGYGFWGPPELETDNLPGTGDERPASVERGDNPDEHHAALARIAALIKARGGADAEAWAEPAARSLKFALDNNRRGWHQLSAATDLFLATGKAEYDALARELFAGLSPSADTDPTPMLVDVVRRYDAAFGGDHGGVLRAMLTRRAEALLKLADNPFGLCTFGPPEKPNFFNTPAGGGGWHVGNSTYLFDCATIAALACQYAPDPRLVEFIRNQFNWTLGVNPFNISLMEGVGSAFLPTYHHRQAFAGVARGAVPGSVVNGVTWRSVGDDRPYVDLRGLDIPSFESNECWLPHNTAYLNALSALRGCE